MMRLPAVFLDMAQFVDVHRVFAVRTRLVQARKDELSKDTQREIVGKACGPHTSADEVKQLSGLGLFTDRELFQFAMSALEQIADTSKAGNDGKSAHQRTTCISSMASLLT